VHVRLSYEPSGLTLAVENRDGTSTNGSGVTGGVGIMGMTERASALGGTLRAGRLPDGFRVDAELPYTGAGE
jgi:signal transduction histidine kinase